MNGFISYELKLLSRYWFHTVYWAWCPPIQYGKKTCCPKVTSMTPHWWLEHEMEVVGGEVRGCYASSGKVWRGEHTLHATQACMLVEEAPVLLKQPHVFIY